MLRGFVEVADALKCLRKRRDGVVSFEYVIMAACIVTTVAAAFNTAAGGTLRDALTGAISSILAAVAAAVAS